MGENTSKELEKERNNFWDPEPDLTALNDLQSELSDLPEKEPSEINFGSIETSYPSEQARTL